MAKKLFFCATLFLTWGLSYANHTLHIMHLTKQKTAYNYPAMVDYTLRLASEREDILPGYKIQAHVTEIPSGGAHIGQVTKGFVEQISQPPVKVAILGPFYTSQAKVIAATAKYYNLIQVGYSTTSPVLTDARLYPYFARTTESTALHNPAIIRILQLYNWRKVATIAENPEFVIGSRDDMERRLARDNVTILASATYSNDPTTQVTQVKDAKAKIIITFNNYYRGMRPLCQAYKDGLYGARYQWIHWAERFGLVRQISDAYTHNDGCTMEQVHEAAEGIITFHPLQMSEYDKTNTRSEDTLYTASEIEENYFKYLNETGWKPADGNKPIFVPDCFEAVWALVLALNRSISALDEIGESLEIFNYLKQNMTRVMYDSLISQQFNGPSGLVRFDRNGDLMSRVVIKQVRSGQIVSLGEYDPVTDDIHFYPGKKVRFQGPRAPYDWDITVYRDRVIDVRLSIFMITLAGVGLVYCIACVAVAFKFRHLKLIKMSSPRINYLIALGCGLSYIDILFFGLDSLNVDRKGWMCGLRVWLLLAGFTLAFGSMFSKTWRVHRLFINNKIQKKVVKDLHLLSFVLVILLVDILLLVIWQVVDPLQWTVHYPQTETDPTEPGKIIQPRMYMCSSKYINYWSGALYAFKGLLLIFGIFFAWETRKVRIEALNDSKMIGISVYNVMIMSVISVPLVSLLSPEQASIKFGITSISILLCTTLTLSLVYATKIFLIYIHGNKVDDLAGTQLPFKASMKQQSSAVTSAAQRIPTNTETTQYNNTTEVRPKSDVASGEKVMLQSTAPGTSTDQHDADGDKSKNTSLQPDILETDS